MTWLKLHFTSRLISYNNSISVPTISTKNTPRQYRRMHGNTIWYWLTFLHHHCKRLIRVMVNCNFKKKLHDILFFCEFVRTIDYGKEEQTGIICYSWIIGKVNSLNLLEPEPIVILSPGRNRSNGCRIAGRTHNQLHHQRMNALLSKGPYDRTRELNYPCLSLLLVPSH